MVFKGESRESILAKYAKFTENCITLEECEERFPTWWRNRVQKQRRFAHLFSRKLRAFRSQFQTTQHLVALRPNPETGEMEPDFDRVIVSEAPNVHVNAYSIDPDGTYWFGVTYNIRQFVEGQRPALCGEIPKGFTLDRVVGPEAANLIDAEEAAGLQIIHELGLPFVTPPRFLRQMRKGNTFDARSVSTIYEAQVDRHAVATELDERRGILASEMIPMSEYGRRVREGTDADGISWDAGFDLSTLQMFLMEHPEAARQFYGL